MGLRAVLLRAAAARPHVLLVTVPGGTAVRLAAERELRSRGWPSASTPAGADLMVVAGPDCAPLRSVLERLWQDMPQPRARVRATVPGTVSSVLDVARDRLSSPGRPRTDAERTAHGKGHRGPERPGGRGHDRRTERSRHTGNGGHGVHGGHADHGGGHGSHREHGGHDGHGNGDMGLPGGLPLAGRGEDRDGLTLDRLHVPLGPFLADWPAGLTVRLVLQGDVVQRAALDRPAARTSADPFWTRPWTRAAAGEPVASGEAARRRAAAHLDSLGRLLSVAGWPAEAVTARRLRDDLLEGAPASVALPRAERLARRVGRSRTLYWLTRGIGPLSAADARAAGVSGPAARADGDVPARYRRWLTDVVDDVRRSEDTAPLDPVARESPRGRWDAGRPPSVALADVLPGLLMGAELGAARLIVASLDPDPDELAVRRAEAARG
ncbi:MULTISPECIES: hypothetical protein [unclassified Streptomyces]|uniref:hypothetical protein n=1 Tax=unclassified Streptomyces TaxID=2593676 RepID=UPI001F03A5F7|nr:MULTISPECIES: hypothetical protein [unclassified Streptomyces]MCH0562420.1 hypothetical protein [Streptomyces sp. MUM 2J]MCH0570396.1 hypothetical protein [Streptomyces sp. MUM 136J]